MHDLHEYIKLTVFNKKKLPISTSKRIMKQWLLLKERYYHRIQIIVSVCDTFISRKKKEHLSGVDILDFSELYQCSFPFISFLTFS